MIKEVSSSKRLHFYIAPINSCARSDFIIKGDRVIFYKTYNDFDYIAYVTKGGETVTGWVKNSDLDAIEPSQTELNASDFSLKIQGVKIGGASLSSDKLSFDKSELKETKPGFRTTFSS